MKRRTLAAARVVRIVAAILAAVILAAVVAMDDSPAWCHATPYEQEQGHTCAVTR